MENKMNSSVNFKGFIDNIWKEFSDKILLQAKVENNVLLEMSQGRGDVSNMHFLPTSHTNDIKYGTQFPGGLLHVADKDINGKPIVRPVKLGKNEKGEHRLQTTDNPEVGSLLKTAMSHRYDDKMIEMGKHWDKHEKFPEEDAHGDIRFRYPGIEAPNPKVAFKQIMTGKSKEDKEDAAYINSLEGSESKKMRNPEVKKRIDRKIKEDMKGKPYYIVITSVDGKKPYIGAKELAEKLTKPAKASESLNLANSEVLKPGPGLFELNPKDPEFEKKKAEYEKNHGYFNFDLANVEDADDIDAIPDIQILHSLNPQQRKEIDDIGVKLNGRGFDSDEERLANPNVEAILDKKRNEMKKVGASSTAGYNPMSDEKATFMTDYWLKLNALGVLDPKLTEKDANGNRVTKQVLDPLTGEMKNLIWLDNDEAKKLLGRDFSVGFKAEGTRKRKGEEKKREVQSGEQQKLELPVIERNVGYKFQDINGEDIKGTIMHHKMYVPWLSDMKALPSHPISPGKLHAWQKALLVHRRGVKGPGGEPLLPELPDRPEFSGHETPEEKKRILDNWKSRLTEEWNKIQSDPKKLNSVKSEDLNLGTRFSEILKHWDLLDNAQKEELVKNSQDLLSIAKTKHITDEEMKSKIREENPYAYDIYSPGQAVNKAEIGGGSLGVKDPAKLKEIIKKYKGEVGLEVDAAIRKWFRDKKYVSEGSEKEFEGLKKWFKDKYGSSSEVTSIGTPGKQNPTVVAAMADKEHSIAKILTYYLITFLNDPTLGVMDPELGLGEPKTVEPVKAAQNRMNLIYRKLTDISHKALSDEIASRRSRKDMKGEKRHAEITGSEGEKTDTSAMHSSKHGGVSDLGAMPLASRLKTGQNVKANIAGDTNLDVPGFMGAIYRRIHRQLRGLADTAVVEDMHNISIAANIANNLNIKFNKELSQKSPEQIKQAYAETLRKYNDRTLQEMYIEEGKTKKEKDDRRKEISGKSTDEIIRIILSKEDSESVKQKLLEDKIKSNLNKELQKMFPGEHAASAEDISSAAIAAMHSQDENKNFAGDKEFPIKFNNAMNEFWKHIYDGIDGGGSTILPKYMPEEHVFYEPTYDFNLHPEEGNDRLYPKYSWIKFQPSNKKAPVAVQVNDILNKMRKVYELVAKDTPGLDSLINSRVKKWGERIVPEILGKELSDAEWDIEEVDNIINKWNGTKQEPIQMPATVQQRPAQAAAPVADGLANYERDLTRWMAPNLNDEERKNSFFEANKALLPVIQKAMSAPKTMRGEIYTRINNAYRQSNANYLKKFPPPIDEKTRNVLMAVSAELKKLLSMISEG